MRSKRNFLHSCHPAVRERNWICEGLNFSLAWRSRTLYAVSKNFRIRRKKPWNPGKSYHFPGNQIRKLSGNCRKNERIIWRWFGIFLLKGPDGPVSWKPRVRKPKLTKSREKNLTGSSPNVPPSVFLLPAESPGLRWKRSSFQKIRESCGFLFITITFWLKSLSPY